MKYLLLFAFAVNSFCTFAQYEPNALCRSLSSGNASVADTSAWSPFHNSAVLSIVPDMGNGKKVHVRASAIYNNRYAVKELSSAEVSSELHLPMVDVGLAYSRFGFSSYNENIAGIALSRYFNRYIVLSVGVDYYFVSHQEIDGTRGNVIAEVGYMCNPCKNLYIGLTAFNPFMTEVSMPGRDFKIGSIYSIGASYCFYDIVTVLCQFDKNVEYDASWHLGLQWDITDWLSAKIGCMGMPFCPDLGMRFRIKGFEVSAMVERHNALGYSSTCSLSYTFR